MDLDLLEYAMIGSYINFVYPADLERVLAYTKSRLLVIMKLFCKPNKP
jgi:hypothetical protein